jgi:hypothetical protein
MYEHENVESGDESMLIEDSVPVEDCYSCSENIVLVLARFKLF